MFNLMFIYFLKLLLKRILFLCFKLYSFSGNESSNKKPPTEQRCPKRGNKLCPFNFRGDDYHLVGFGPYKLMSRFDLYNSTQEEHRNYVTSTLNTNVTYPGGQLDKLKRYIEKEDRRRQQEQLEDQLLFKAAEEAELRHKTDSAPR